MSALISSSHCPATWWRTARSVRSEGFARREQHAGNICVRGGPSADSHPVGDGFERVDMKGDCMTVRCSGSIDAVSARSVKQGQPGGGSMHTVVCQPASPNLI